MQRRQDRRDRPGLYSAGPEGRHAAAGGEGAVCHPGGVAGP
ncbi:hypothetical protein LG3211_1809 [Lysobacter gummosus]|nr:hypothetical protein LG3211_1809 [Lysobacter gummosus]